MQLNNLPRTLGDGGLSIGTYLSMESVFDLPKYDPEREVPEKIDLTKYNYFLFNHFTLIRNVLNSFEEKDKVKLMDHKDFFLIIENEINILEMYFSAFPNCKFIIYQPTYDDIVKNYNLNKGELSTVPYTQWLILYQHLKGWYKDKRCKLNQMVNVLKDHKLERLEGDIILCTHIPCDLLNRGRISLLESHTGKLKTQKDYYSKLHDLGTKDLSHIPFVEESLYIFGGGHLIKPMSLFLRREVYKISQEKNWTYKTTRDKLKMDLNNNISTKDIFKGFKRMYL